MAERGIALAHTTIVRWVQQYVPDFEQRYEAVLRSSDRQRDFEHPDHERPRRSLTATKKMIPVISKTHYSFNCRRVATDAGERNLLWTQAELPVRAHRAIASLYAKPKVRPPC
jgi:hypothetical protein